MTISKHYPKLDPKTGHFVKTPPGQKTPKMLDVEKKIGTTLEKDYKEQYLSGKMGQKRLAGRWGVERGLIFRSYGPHRGWVAILSLPQRGEKAIPKVKKAKAGCELCGETEVRLDKAHWVSSAGGGSMKSHNILSLCPNHHRKLDRDDSKTIETAREVLLLREVKKLLQRSDNELTLRKKLVRLASAILNREALKDL